ncbi:gibberellin 2-beta-dioxygenase 8 [Nicotiana tabacum]|uniref:Gibberellin 2-beta-dioxygenase 8 n=2 Tax=Nicotiana TaxID=4085 RepID=A0A1S3Z0R6_TOBAC|nr:PREDICTED: gibberellin 2-beta-dioxygenase 8 isoform X1 [Nicotiana sylvestris]XP_016458046.1 PREDICTED: gibberellin 2-beta-dioxygenase 8-like isoform X1 [Nicotiana tabacum]
MSKSNFESYPPLFRPANIPRLDRDKAETLSKLAVEAANIPVISIDLQCTTSCMSEACRNWGLFRLANHGIPITLLNQIEEHAKKLFSLPYETKKAFFSSSPISYFWGTPALTPSGSAIPQKPNNQQSLQWMEGFNVSLSQLSHLHYQDVLLETFRCLLEEYGKHQSRLATTIFKVLASDLNLGPLQTQSHLSVATGLLRVYRYPRCHEPEGAWGIDVHTDSSVLSIIHQDEVGGLQVYSKDHQWLDVNPLPNTLIVNIGDMLQAMSDDKYMSVKHRVKVNKHKERISIGYFVFPAEDAIIQSTNYKPFTYADFRAQVQHDLKTVGIKTGLQKFKFTTQIS